MTWRRAESNDIGFEEEGLFPVADILPTKLPETLAQRVMEGEYRLEGVHVRSEYHASYCSTFDPVTDKFRNEVPGGTVQVFDYKVQVLNFGGKSSLYESGSALVEVSGQSRPAVDKYVASLEDQFGEKEVQGVH